MWRAREDRCTVDLMVDLSWRLDVAEDPRRQLQHGLARTAAFIALFCAIPGVAALFG